MRRKPGGKEEFPEGLGGDECGWERMLTGPVSKPRADKSDGVAVKTTGRLPLGGMDRM